MHFFTSRVDGVATLRIVGELDAVTGPDLLPSVDAWSLNGNLASSSICRPCG
jgi:hypothetical protein